MSGSRLLTHPYIALRWSANVVGREVYKHLAPLEPEHRLVVWHRSKYHAFEEG